MLSFQEITHFSKPLRQNCCCNNISMQAQLGCVCHHICRLDERGRASCEVGMACKVLELKMKSVLYLQEFSKKI
jgi:hypothetical protein